MNWPSMVFGVLTKYRVHNVSKSSQAAERKAGCNANGKSKSPSTAKARWPFVVVTVTVWPVATVVTVVAAPLDNVTVAIEVVPDLVVVEVNEMVPVPWLVFA